MSGLSPRTFMFFFGMRFDPPRASIKHKTFTNPPWPKRMREAINEMNMASVYTNVYGVSTRWFYQYIVVFMESENGVMQTVVIGLANAFYQLG